MSSDSEESATEIPVHFVRSSNARGVADDDATNCSAQNDGDSSHVARNGDRHSTSAPARHKRTKQRTQSSRSRNGPSHRDSHIASHTYDNPAVDFNDDVNVSHSDAVRHPDVPPIDLSSFASDSEQDDHTRGRKKRRKRKDLVRV